MRVCLHCPTLVGADGTTLELTRHTTVNLARTLTYSLRQAPKSLERFLCAAPAQVGADGTSLEADNGDVVAGVDVIIFATGFDITAPLGQFDIRAHGTTLEETLEAVPEAYYGTAVAGFPNLFTLLGPNTGNIGNMLHGGMLCCNCTVVAPTCALHRQAAMRGNHRV